MFKKFKTSVSFLLSLCLLLSWGIPSYAQIRENTSVVEGDLGLQFLKATDKQLIYTFVRDNNEYMYIDNFIDENTVQTIKYIKENGSYKIYEDIVYEDLGVVNGEKDMLLDKSTEELLDPITSINSGYNFRWKYVSSTSSSTKLEKTSVGVIAIILAGVAGGGTSLVMGVAAYLFEAMVDVVYYDQTLYTDANAPSFSPNYKKNTYWYLDKNHTEPSDPAYTINIIQTWWG